MNKKLLYEIIIKELEAEFSHQTEDVKDYQLVSCAECIIMKIEQRLTLLAPDTATPSENEAALRK